MVTEILKKYGLILFVVNDNPHFPDTLSAPVEPKFLDTLSAPDVFVLVKLILGNKFIKQDVDRLVNLLKPFNLEVDERAKIANATKYSSFELINWVYTNEY